MKSIKVLAVIPYEGLREHMLKAAKGYENVSMQVVVGTMETGLKFAVEAEKANYDIIISRGGTAETIEEVVSLPVVHVPVSVFDYVKIIENTGRTLGKTAIIGYANVTEDAYPIKTLSNSNIDIFTIMNPKEIMPLLEQLKNEGFAVIVGDVVTVDYARILGMKGILMESGIESARKSVAEAVRIYGYIEKYKSAVNMKIEKADEKKEQHFVYECDETLESFENKVIKALSQGKNTAKLSQQLGISRSTLWRRLKEM